MALGLHIDMRLVEGGSRTVSLRTACVVLMRLSISNWRRAFVQGVHLNNGARPD